ncbi:MAG: hypothetical protein JXL80_10045 [Planctomycetes bacterium]|nr:hypothetical protein [Planctomycetota bacterium]
MSSIATHRAVVEQVIQGPVPLNLRDVEQLAGEAVERARAKAREILTEAVARAKEMEQVASARGEKAGYDAGFAKGHEAGKAEALAAETRRIQKETATLNETLLEVLRGIEGHRNDLLAEAKQDLLLLSLTMAERICRLKLSGGDEHVRPLLEEVIEHTGTQGRMIVRINPQDAEAAEKFLGGLHAALTADGVSPIKVLADEGVTRGGCVAERVNGKVDAQLETQINRIAAELIGLECPVRPESATSPESPQSGENE